MALNHHGKSFIILANGGKQDTAVIYYSNLTLENVGADVNYRSICITLAPRVYVLKLFTEVIYECSLYKKRLVTEDFFYTDIHNYNYLQ